MLQERAANMVARLLPDATVDDKAAGLLRAVGQQSRCPPSMWPSTPVSTATVGTRPGSCPARPSTWDRHRPRTGSAYVNHRDDTGTVAEGHLADLVVLDRDPFEGGDDGIGSTRVLRTFVGGQEVYAAGS